MKVVVKPRGFDRLQAFVKSMPRGLVKATLVALSIYYLQIFQQAPPQKYVSRKQAGYKTSAAQIRYFFAVGILEADDSGNVKLNRYERTGDTAKAWKVTGSPYQPQLVNETAGAYYTMDDDGQANQPRLVGWKKVSKIIKDNITGAIKAVRDAGEDFLRDLLR